MSSRRLGPREMLERRLTRTMAMPLVLSAILALALVGELVLLLQSAGWVDHTDQVIAQARQIENLLAEAPVGPSAAADAAIAHEMDVLGGLVADNAAQVARYQRLAARFAAARGGDRGASFTELRRTLRDFVRVEERLRDERSRHVRRLSRAIVAATLLGALVIGGALGLFGRRQLHAVAAEYESAMVQAREQALLLSDQEKFRRLIESVADYAIFLLDADGNVASWNAGAERATGWRADEIMGQHFAVFFTPEDRAAGVPARQLAEAAATGVARGESLRARKDGSSFVAEVTLTAVRDPSRELIGFAKIAHDVSARRRAEAAIANLNAELAARVHELAAANGELEAFSYSVSHDLRGPLRAIDGFSKILMEQYQAQLDEQGRHFLTRVRAGSQRMGQLIDDLLGLARINRAEMHTSDVDLAALARAIVDELRGKDPARAVEVVIADRLPVRGDPRLLRVALDNLLANAWKFTGKTEAARIEIGCMKHDGGHAYFVKDNGAGFDMAYVHKLFAPFQRLHAQSEFEGTGVGLATVHRIVTRHGGKMWAEAAPEKGATFWFTLGKA